MILHVRTIQKDTNEYTYIHELQDCVIYNAGLKALAPIIYIVVCRIMIVLAQR